MGGHCLRPISASRGGRVVPGCVSGSLRAAVGVPSVQESLQTPHFCQDEALRPERGGTRRLHSRACPSDAPPHGEMKG